MVERSAVNGIRVGSSPSFGANVRHGGYSYYVAQFTVYPSYMNSKDVGEISEGMVLAALLRARKIVLRPFGDNQRYDLVVDEDGTFVRIQCKTARLKDVGSYDCKLHLRQPSNGQTSGIRYASRYEFSEGSLVEIMKDPYSGQRELYLGDSLNDSINLEDSLS